MEIKIKKITDLKGAEYNPRLLNPQEREDIRKSLKAFGFVQPVVINTFKGRENVIIGGHQRISVWTEMGNTEVPCLEVSLNPDQEKELNVRLNKNTGHWDMEKLSRDFDQVKLIDWGFSLSELPKIDDINKSMDEKTKFDPTKSQSEENYNISYQIVFNNEGEQADWFNFIKKLKEQYPEIATISERLIKYIKEHE